MCTLVGPVSSRGLTEGRPPGGGCGHGAAGVSSVRLDLVRLPLEAGQLQHRGDVGSQGTARVHPSLGRKRMPSLPHLPNAGWSAEGRSKEMQLPFQKVHSLCRVCFGPHQLLAMRRPLAAWQKPGISCLLKPFPVPWRLLPPWSPRPLTVLPGPLGARRWSGLQGWGWGGAGGFSRGAEGSRTCGLCLHMQLRQTLIPAPGGGVASLNLSAFRVFCVCVFFSTRVWSRDHVPDQLRRTEMAITSRREQPGMACRWAYLRTAQWPGAGGGRRLSLDCAGCALERGSWDP